MYIEFHTDYIVTDKGWIADYITSRETPSSAFPLLELRASRELVKTEILQ